MKDKVNHSMAPKVWLRKHISQVFFGLKCLLAILVSLGAVLTMAGSMTLYASAAFKDDRQASYNPTYAKITYDAYAQTVSIISVLGAQTGCTPRITPAGYQITCCSWTDDPQAPLDSICLANVSSPPVQDLYVFLLVSAMLFIGAYALLFLFMCLSWTKWCGQSRIKQYLFVVLLVFGIVSMVVATILVKAWPGLLMVAFYDAQDKLQFAFQAHGTNSQPQLAPAPTTGNAFLLLNVTAAFMLSIAFDVCKSAYSDIRSFWKQSRSTAVAKSELQSSSSSSAAAPLADGSLHEGLLPPASSRPNDI
jgi:hypothetical protein